MQVNVIAGNISTDIEFSEEKGFAKFNLATDTYLGKNEDGSPKIDTLYLPLTAFKNNATAISQNCKKGDQLILEYNISNNNYEKDGKKVYGYNFVVTSFKFGKKAG